MFTNIKIIITLIVVFLSGCAAQGERFSGFIEPSNGNAVVYLFRQSAFAGSVYCPNLNVNGDSFGCLKMNGYYRIEMPAGKNEICFCKSIFEVGDNLKLDMVLSAGEVRYFEWVPHISNFVIIGGNVIPSGGKMESVIEHKAEPSLKILNSLKLSG